MSGVLLGVALAVLLPEVRRCPAYTIQIRDGVALVGRSTRSLVAAAGRRYGRWLVCHPDHPFAYWKVMRKQAWKLAVPIKYHPIIKVMLTADCKEACNEVQSDKPIYSNPANEYFDSRFQRDEGVLSTIWHSMPAAGTSISSRCISVPSRLGSCKTQDSPEVEFTYPMNEGHPR
jgi:hypothetical protein